MEILRELYFGNISEIERKDKNANSPLKLKERDLLNTVKDKLPEEDKILADQLIDIIYENRDEDLIEKYIQGLKIGILIGIDVNNLEL